MRRHKYGNWGRHLELMEMFREVRDNPAALALLVGKDYDEQVEEALRESYGSPEGTIDFPIFLQTVIRHRIRERFRGVASKWEQYFGIESAQDFREHTTSELGAIRGFGGVGEHQEYHRLRSSEAPAPPYAVGKYGGIYGVTYELVVNDEMNRILNAIPRELGRSFAEYMAQVFVALIESNPTYIDGLPFFDASRGNTTAGGGATLNEDNVLAALDALSLKRDRDGVPIRVELSKVLVRAPSQAARLFQMIRSTETGVQDTGAGQARGTYNALSDLLPNDAPVVEPWLNDANDYYFLTNADDRPAFVAAFLRNRRDPAIFQQDSGMRGVGGGESDPYSMDFDEVPFKLRHVFGGAPGEPMAAHRMQP